MNLKNRIIALVAATAIAVPAVALGAYQLKGGKSVVKIGAVLPTGHVDCTNDNVTLEDTGTELKVIVGLNETKTGLGMRDGHFKDKMTGSSFKDKKGTPAAVLRIKTSDIKGKKSGSHTIPATLDLFKKSRPVNVHITNIEEKGDHLKVTAKVKDPNPGKSTECLEDPKDKDCEKIKGINYRDFGIGAKEFCFAGVCVKDNLDISAEIYISKE
jgi:hypothetical protein